VVVGELVGGGRVARRRLSVQEAAEVLGTSVDALRSRIRRGSIESEKDPDGRVFVWLGSDQAGDKPQAEVEGTRELVGELRDRVRSLEDQLREERRANDENRRLLAAALERIPAIEAPVTPSEEPDSAAEPRSNTEGEREGAEQPPTPALVAGVLRVRVEGGVA
jgi:hypothetical protein